MKKNIRGVIVDSPPCKKEVPNKNNLILICFDNISIQGFKNLY